MPEAAVTEERLAALEHLCTSAQGDVPVSFEVVTGAGRVVSVRPSQFLRVNSSQYLTDSITATCPDWELDLILA
jgi:hypothetical protein